MTAAYRRTCSSVGRREQEESQCHVNVYAVIDMKICVYGSAKTDNLLLWRPVLSELTKIFFIIFLCDYPGFLVTSDNNKSGAAEIYK